MGTEEKDGRWESDGVEMDELLRGRVEAGLLASAQRIQAGEMQSWYDRSEYNFWPEE